MKRPLTSVCVRGGWCSRDTEPLKTDKAFISSLYIPKEEGRVGGLQDHPLVDDALELPELSPRAFNWGLVPLHPLPGRDPNSRLPGGEQGLSTNHPGHTRSAGDPISPGNAGNLPLKFKFPDQPRAFSKAGLPST